MIFIGENHEGQVISIISAADEKSANAYWQGKDQLPYRTRIFDISKDRENEKLGFVTPILKTKEVQLCRPEDRYMDRKFVVVDNS